MARKRRVPKAIFYRDPETGKRLRWRSGPPPVDEEGNPLRLFDSRGRKVRNPRRRDSRSPRLSNIRLPSPDPNAAINRRKIVQFGRAKSYALFWLRAATIKPGEKEIIWIGTKVFTKPITTRVAAAMLRDVSRRALKSGESILAIDLVRRPKFKPKKRKRR